MPDAKREDYDWVMFQRDLALSTALTIRETWEWSEWVKANDLHPYDALPHVMRIVQSLPDVHVGPAFFSNMAALFNLKDSGTT